MFTIFGDLKSKRIFFKLDNMFRSYSDGKSGLQIGVSPGKVCYQGDYTSLICFQCPGITDLVALHQRATPKKNEMRY